MKRAVMCAAVAAIVLSGCNKPASDTQQPAATPTQETALFNANAVWHGDLTACAQQDQAWNTCLIDTISKTGSSDAVAAARYLTDHDNPGYISGYTQAGNVGVAEATYPGRANTNTGTLLVPSQGDPVDVDQFAQQDLTRFDAWKTFAQQHPDATPWAPGKLVETTKKDSGQQFVYIYSVQTCHACDSIATLRVGFDFDGQGHFVKSDILNVK